MSKTTATDTFRRLKAVMKDVDGDHRQIIKCLQKQVEYLLEKCKIVEEIAIEKNDGKAVVYSDEQKKRLAVKGKALNEFLLGTIEQTFAPCTVFGWYRELVGKKYNSVGSGQKRRGRPVVWQGVGPAKETSFAVYDQKAIETFYEYMKLKKIQREYGFFNYGDWFGERGKNWGNNEYDLASGLFLLFLRTGNRDAFRWAKIAACCATPWSDFF